MYKVFFNDRRILIGADCTGMPGENNAVAYRYASKEQLREWVEDFLGSEEIHTLCIHDPDPDQLFRVFKSLFRCMQAAGGLVTNDTGNYLGILKRGRWDLPKGKVDGNESLEQAALREISEECGITEMKIIRPLCTTYHIFIQEGQPYLKCTQWFDIDYHGREEPKPQTREHIRQVKWINSAEDRMFRDSTYPSILEILDYRSS